MVWCSWFEVLGILNFFLPNVTQTFAICLVSTLKLSNGLHWRPVTLSYCGVMNTDLNWGKRGLQSFSCTSWVFCDLLDELLISSWGIIGTLAISWKVLLRYYVFSTVTVVYWSPKALEMVLWPSPLWYGLLHVVRQVLYGEVISWFSSFSRQLGETDLHKCG